MDSSVASSEVFDPTGNIPTEILAYIFHLCTDATTFQASSPSNLPAQNRWHWSVITHVCARWRAVAIANPSFWQQLDLGAPLAWTETVALRAPPAGPLHIACSRPITLIDSDRLVRGIISRVRTLHIEDSSRTDVSDYFAEALGAPAPLLEQATLRARLFAKLPKDLFGGHAPLLRRLVLKEVYLNEDMDTSILSGLVSLSMNCDNGDLSVPLRFVRATPDLEDLTLHTCNFERDTGHQDDPIELPRLSHLSLEGGMNCLAQTLSHLRIPSTARITTSVTDHWTDIDEVYREVYTHLSRGGPFALPFISVTLGHSDETTRAATLRLLAWREDPGHNMRSEALLDLDFQMHFRERGSMLGPSLEMMHRAFDAPRYLDIAIEDDARLGWGSDTTVWSGFLQSDFTGRVETIRTPVRGAHELCKALRASPGFACPQLTVLRLVVESIVTETDQDSGIDVIVGAVAACVKERGEAGRPIRVEVEGNASQDYERAIQVAMPEAIMLRDA
ncbi:hypothetical protein FA95DRAFT_1555754 [Auriscalpium vulgare]|uniref:Uncharacterized protein n=1 Tax=Auriscalpium vulgare TaxID=40419 RepID=A0ACB8S1R2_9AGAM|nr:hypothetical protein FA95DRAFT_1555754 [Auriscalpium vulgare]